MTSDEVVTMEPAFVINPSHYNARSTLDFTLQEQSLITPKSRSAQFFPVETSRQWNLKGSNYMLMINNKDAAVALKTDAAILTSYKPPLDVDPWQTPGRPRSKVTGRKQKEL